MALRRGGWLATLLCAAWLAACSGGEPPASSPDAARVRFGTNNPLVTFDPHLADTGPQFSSYLTLVYDGLTELDPADPLRPIPGLATGWTWRDAVTVDLPLHQGVRFSDGTPFDAHAAAANIERLIRLAGPRINTVASLQGASAVDDFTVRLHLHHPDPTLLYNLALSPGMMVSPAAFDNADLDLNPVGTGPWRYDKARSKIGAVHRFGPTGAHFNPRHRDVPAVDVHVLTNRRARLNALISGQIDIAIVSPTEAAAAEDLGFGIARRANRWFGFTILDRIGESTLPLGDARVRQALGFAVDRRAIAEAVFFGYARAASQPMVEGLGHVPQLENFFTYDPARARALLAAAGFADGFSFATPVLPDNSAEYEAVQGYLRDVGIDMEITVIEPGTIATHARSKTFPVSTIGYPNFDPDSRHPAIWSATAAFNPFGHRDERIERLAEEARRSLDESLRERNYQRYFNILVKEVFSLVYLQLDDLAIYDAAKLCGVEVGRYIDPMLREIRLAAPAEASRC